MHKIKRLLKISSSGNPGLIDIAVKKKTCGDRRMGESGRLGSGILNQSDETRPRFEAKSPLGIVTATKKIINRTLNMNTSCR